MSGDYNVHYDLGLSIWLGDQGPLWHHGDLQGLCRVPGGDHLCHPCCDILLACGPCCDPSGRDLLPGRDAPATDKCWGPAVTGVLAGRAARLESRRSCLPTEYVL